MYAKVLEPFKYAHLLLQSVALWRSFLYAMTGETWIQAK